MTYKYSNYEPAIKIAMDRSSFRMDESVASEERVDELSFK